MLSWGYSHAWGKGQALPRRGSQVAHGACSASGPGLPVPGSLVPGHEQTIGVASQRRVPVMDSPCLLPRDARALCLTLPSWWPAVMGAAHSLVAAWAPRHAGTGEAEADLNCAASVGVLEFMPAAIFRELLLPQSPPLRAHPLGCGLDLCLMHLHGKPQMVRAREGPRQPPCSRSSV